MEQKEFVEFKENVDSWIKDFMDDLSRYKHIPKILEETVDNTQHNYELVRELRCELEDLKQEIKLLRAAQILMLRDKAMKKI